jgi:hypothetical protein
MSNGPTVKEILASRQAQEKVLSEIASDNPSNYGGWQGGFPGSGSALTGIRKGSKDDTGKTPSRSATFQHRQGQFKLSGTKTKIILEPTMKQSQNDLDVKNPTLAKPDQPQKPVRQVKEELAEKALQRFFMKSIKSRPKSLTPLRSLKTSQKPLKPIKLSGLKSPKSLTGRSSGLEVRLGGLVAKGVKHLVKKAFAPKISAAEPEVKANPKLSGPWGDRFKITQTGPKISGKPPKPPTQAQQKQADLDASNAKFSAWKTKKADMTHVFKAAHAAGIGNEINPIRNKLGATANPLKQPSTSSSEPPTFGKRVAPPSATKEQPKDATGTATGAKIGKVTPKPAPELKPRMSAKEFSAWQKQHPKASIRGAGGLHEVHGKHRRNYRPLKSFSPVIMSPREIEGERKLFGNRALRAHTFRATP